MLSRVIQKEFEKTTALKRWMATAMRWNIYEVSRGSYYNWFSHNRMPSWLTCRSLRKWRPGNDTMSYKWNWACRQLSVEHCITMTLESSRIDSIRLTRPWDSFETRRINMDSWPTLHTLRTLSHGIHSERGQRRTREKMTNGCDMTKYFRSIVTHGSPP